MIKGFLKIFTKMPGHSLAPYGLNETKEKLILVIILLLLLYYYSDRKSNFVGTVESLASTASTKFIYSLFILVMCILLQRISNPRDFVKYIGRKMSLQRKELTVQKLLFRGKIKKVLPVHLCVHWSKLRTRNSHDQNEHTL